MYSSCGVGGRPTGGNGGAAASTSSGVTPGL